MTSRGGEGSEPEDGLPDPIVEVVDEREPLSREALQLIADSFPPHDRQPLSQIEMEIAEKRHGLLGLHDFHLFAARTESGRAMAVASGIYLGGINAGFITYLAVRPEYRAQRLGRRIRRRLVDALRENARGDGHDELSWVVGEVRLENPWLRRLVRERAAVPFAFDYYHPGVSPDDGDERWILYRQPIGDHREELPATEVKALVYAIWRRAYRVRWPLERPGFAAMVEELEEIDTVGVHPGVAD